MIAIKIISTLIISIIILLFTISLLNFVFENEDESSKYSFAIFMGVILISLAFVILTIWVI